MGFICVQNFTKAAQQLVDRCDCCNAVQEREQVRLILAAHDVDPYFLAIQKIWDYTAGKQHSVVAHRIRAMIREIIDHPAGGVVDDASSKPKVRRKAKAKTKTKAEAKE